MYNNFAANNGFIPYNPYPVTTVPAQKVSLINKVNGLDSAKAFQTQPNTEVVLFDANEDIFYLKTTDASNFPSIRTFKFTEVKSQTDPTGTEYVTKEEFDKFKKELLNGKQHLWRGKSGSKPAKQYSTDKGFDGSSEQIIESSVSASDYSAE